MGWFRNTFGRPAAQEPRNESLDDFLAAFAVQYATSSGVSVTSDSAVASVAVLACILVRAESLMFCPVDVYRKAGNTRLAQPDHPVAKLIARDPNTLLTSQELWRWKQIREDLTGNAHIRIEWDHGRPVALWPMWAGKPTLLRGKDGLGRPMIGYQYTGDDFTPANTYPAADVMHFRGPLLSNPYEGRSLVQVTAQNIGLDIASAEFFARFLANGTHFPNYFESDSALTEEDKKAFAQQFKDGAGLLPAGKLRIFDRGLKLKNNPMSLKDADLSSHQRWILEQVCRTWRVPPQMVQDLSHGTYTNSEQADLWLSKHTMAPIVANTEGRTRKALLAQPGDADLYVKWNLNAMLRGDFQTRTAGYSILINCGVLSPNEARAMEDWNPYDGGDEYRVPLNTGPASADAVAAITTGGTDLTAGLAPLLGDARDRIMARVGDNLRRGRPVEDSVQFACLVLDPIAKTYRNLGLQLDVTGTAREWTGADLVERHL